MLNTPRTASAALPAATLAFSYLLRAMEIQKFDTMADSDPNSYVTALIDGAEKVLKAQGHPDQAEQVEELFFKNIPGDRLTLGQTEFERSLALLRANDAKNALAHPKDPRLEVEDAIVATLHGNGIELPDSFYTVAKTFRPKLPPQKK
jgi:hypothetical protein